jgi:hypothetical protein
MRGRGAGRIVLLVIAAAAFGALESIVKGNGAGVRDGIGNLSAPWVIVPLLAGAVGSRVSILLGAAVGLLTSLAALVGFYVANAFVLDLGAHSWSREIGLTLNAGNVWFKAGAVSGPAMGAVGAWAGRRGGFVIAWSVVGLVTFEPLVVYLTYLASHGRFAAGDGEWNGIYAAEAALGAVAAVALWSRARPVRRD